MKSDKQRILSNEFKNNEMEMDSTLIADDVPGKKLQPASLINQAV